MAFQTKTVFSILYKATFDFVLYTVILATILAFLPAQLFTNFPLTPTSYEVRPEKAKQWTTVLSDKSELLLKEQIVGPESLVSKNDVIYMGLADGRVVYYDTKTQTLKELTNFWTSSDCGELCLTFFFLSLTPIIFPKYSIVA